VAMSMLEVAIFSRKWRLVGANLDGLWSERPSPSLSAITDPTCKVAIDDGKEETNSDIEFR